VKGPPGSPPTLDAEPDRRVTAIRFDRHELAGGLGDAGLFIPIAIALITINGLNATAVFAVSGLVYIATALYFRVPVPVQPLKAFAAAAIALGLDAATLAAGGLLMAAAMAVLAATGLAAWLAARFPVVLVRGIQAGVALLLVKAAVELAQRGNWSGLPPIDPALSLAIALSACAVLFLSRRTRAVPGALVVLVAGVAVGLAVGGAPSGLSPGPEAVALSIPDAAAFATALTALVIAQIPLTFGNSVVATADAERSYFGERASRVQPNRLAASIAGANVAAGVTGGLAVCHGAGGATAHYKLGARTAGATLSVGVLFVVLGIGFGEALPAVLMTLAPGALAGMLLYVALQHGLLAARLDRLDDRLLAAGVGLVTILSGNLAIGFGGGVAVLALRAMWRSGMRPGPARA
jgi:SulP family sulfate permease